MSIQKQQELAKKEFDKLFCFPVEAQEDIKGWINPPPNQRQIKAFLDQQIEKAYREGRIEGMKYALDTKEEAKKMFEVINSSKEK